MNQTEIEQNIEDSIILRVEQEVINKYIQYLSAIKQRIAQRIEEEEKAKVKRENARYARHTNYYVESAQARGQRMRKHNDTVASQGYGSSYF